MSITTELRDYMRDYLCDAPYSSMSSALMSSIYALKSSIASIADRIDQEHEECAGFCRRLEDAAKEGEEVTIFGTDYIELPKDADGEYIHIGDVMDSRVDYLFDGKPFTVRALALCEDGWEAADGRFGNRYEPDSLRHHHEPTVEDVLRDVVTLCHNTWKEESPFHFYDVDDVMKSGNIADFAAKLRLAGDEE